MAIIHNTWVEKTKKKKADTQPAYESYKNDFESQTRKPKTRHAPSFKANMSRTLRGTRK